MSRVSLPILLAVAFACPLRAGAQDAVDQITAWFTGAEQMSKGKGPDSWVPALAPYWPKLCELNSQTIGEDMPEEYPVGRSWLIAYSLFCEARLPLWARQRNAGVAVPPERDFRAAVLNGFTAVQVIRGKQGMINEYGVTFLGRNVSNPLRVRLPEFDDKTGSYIDQAIASWLQAFPHRDPTSNAGTQGRPGRSAPIGFVAGPEAEWCAQVLPYALAGRKCALLTLSAGASATDTEKASEMHLKATSLAACALYYYVLHQIGFDANTYGDHRFFTPLTP